MVRGTTTYRSSTAHNSAPGASITGPALVAHPFTTIVLRPGDIACVLEHGDILVDVAR